MLLVFKEAFLGFSRSKTMSFFAIVATGFSLLTLGLFVLVLLNLNALIRRLEDKVEVMVYLKEEMIRLVTASSTQQLSS